jgi:hypothetical protein
MTVALESEVILTGTFQLQGTGDLANLNEFVGTPSPFAPGPPFPPSPFPHGNVLVNRLIHTDQPWEVKLNWVVGGIMAHTVNPNFYWEIEVLLEKWGINEYELPIGVRKRTLTYGSGIFSGTGPSQIIGYPGTPVNSTTISIPGGTVPPGVYGVVAVLRLLEADGVTPCFLAAFAEFGKVDFYEGH